MFNYLIYRVFRYFYRNKNEKEKAASRTVNFLVLLEGSLVVPVFMLINALTKHNSHIFGDDDNKMKYLIGIPLAEILILIHSTLVKKKLNGIHLSELKRKYHRDQYMLPIWVIFATPIFFIFVFPVVLNGLMSFQFIEQLFFQPLWV